MEKLLLKSTETTPDAAFYPDGNLLIKGRAYSENPSSFFDPLQKFCTELEVEEVTFEIHLDYLNTASSKCLLEVIAALEDNPNIEQVELKWHYEVGDEEMLETGEIYEESFDKVKFVFIQTQEIISDGE